MVWTVGTNPLVYDTDNDGFPDGYEVNVLNTNPLEYTKDSDFDNDGV